MKDDEFQLARVEELHQRAVFGEKAVFSDFFSYSELANVMRSLPKAVRNDAVLYGGYPDAERKCFFFLAKADLEKFDEEILGEEAIHCYLIEQRSPRYANPLTHSSVLGKLMSLGIKREMLGDIIAKEDMAVIFALAKIEEEILSIEDVGRDAVSIRRIQYEESPIKMEFEIRRITYESNRLDAIVSSVFRLSREDAKKAIETGMVFLTSASIPKPSSTVEEGDHISMKGEGKVIFLNEVGTSKKGKTVAEIKVPK